MPALNGSSKSPGKICTSAPGRICLFGEHQDYLGLPVIAAAIDLRVQVEAVPRDQPGFDVCLPDIGATMAFDPNVTNPYSHERDYLVAAANVLRRQGLRWPRGYRIVIHGRIPINSGASSSSALQAAWVAFLFAAAGDDRWREDTEVARAAHESEVTEFDSPGGMMDHFACSVGGLIWLDCQPPYRVECLPGRPGPFVLVDSGIPKDTNSVLGEKRRRVENLDIPFHEFNGDENETAERLLLESSANDRPLLEATLSNRRLTRQAARLIRSGANPSELGKLLDAHHDQLSRNLGISVPKIDELLRIGREAGALGGKINGSGGGGSFFLLCPDKALEIQRLYTEMGYNAWVVSPGEGLKVQIEEPVEVTPS